MLATYITYCFAFYFLMRLSPSRAHATAWSDLADFAAQGQDKSGFGGGEPPFPPDAITKPLLCLPSSFTLQGHLMLATPLQLACSLWRGLSGGEHASTALRSPNEMPVSEGACETVKVR